MTIVRLVIGLCCVAAWAGAAAAAGDGDATCQGYGALAEKPVLALGRVKATTPRAHFVKGGDDRKGCPDDMQVCRDKAFVVAGDLLITGRSRGAFVCADFTGAKGADRAGWLPAADIATVPSTAPSFADWLGTWHRDEATIVLKAAAQGGKDIIVKGDATFGAHDPDRVKRGGVNIGEIAATWPPSGDGLAFAMGQDGTLPVDKGGEFDCKVWMKRLGPYLIVDDNNGCGGMNVTFRGTYLRTK